MALFSVNAHAVTFEEYIVDQDSTELRSYLTGYIDALYDNAYLIGGCPRKIPYRPYGEFFQHIEIYIAKESQVSKKDLEKFYKKPIEPFITAIALKYIDCDNPESLKLKNEKKEVQLAARDIARQIMEETKKYTSPIEREKEFQYEKFLDKLKNPKKYEKQCPVCKICPAFTPVPLPEQNMTPVPSVSPPPPPVIPQKPEEKPKPEILIEDKKRLPKKAELEKQAQLHIEKSELNPIQTANTQVTTEEKKPIENTLQSITPDIKKPEEKLPDPEVKKEEKPEKTEETKENVHQNDENKTLAEKLKDISNAGSTQGEAGQGINKLDDKVEPLALPSKAEKHDALKKGIEKIQTKVDQTKYKLEKLDINFDNLDAITLPD